MIDPVTIGIGALIWAVFKKQNNTQFGQLTPERDEVYRNAMEYLRDPSKLRELAKEFHREGLRAQAIFLQKRAEWRARGPELKAKHEAIFAKALQSTNIQAILEVAKQFEGMTATIKAAQLRERVKSLRAIESSAEEKPEESESEPEVRASPEGNMSRHNSNGITKPEEKNGGLQEDSAKAE